MRRRRVAPCQAGFLAPDLKSFEYSRSGRYCHLASSRRPEGPVGFYSGALVTRDAA